ncbi:carboxyltransferase domain-containing protein [Nesterenkonia pannonica]|uniref:carboxyltransferase domain-containing protein n=1 Tax=Nesterenkonia pannonica TaxID=1548602 RepID=UPI00216482AA|nr:carboxyltransferase domain-containing protein [Nesterenkonia pannonica]
MSAPTIPENARYTFGGDEFLFVEIDAAMSLAANTRAMTIAQGLRSMDLAGLIEICPANASLLLRVDPDILDPRDLRTEVQKLEEQSKAASSVVLQTRIVEVPVWYEDPYTDETVWKYREGYHQEPTMSDLDYAAKVNGLTDKHEFIRRHHSSPGWSPWSGSWPGCRSCSSSPTRRSRWRCPSTSARGPPAPRADRGARRRLQRHILRARSAWLPDVRPRSGTHLRPPAEGRGLRRIHDLLPAR